MKRSVLLLAFAFTAYAAGANTQDQNNEGSFRKINNVSFKPGEELRYRMHYGFVDAGEATLKVKDCDRKMNGRKMLHVEGVGNTISAFDWFFKVRDRYESYIDAEGVFPWLFIRRVNEGGYVINQDYTFLQHKKKVDNGEGKTFETPEMVQDMISAFYYARTLDFQNAKKGDEFTIPMFYDNTNFPLKIKFVGRETINVRMGKFRCLKFAPVVEKGRVFKSEEDLAVWVTDDNNKIPLLAKAKILVGSIKMEVVEYKNLASPISKVTK
ncbi:MAG: DUF3108 domain-containing protein [Flavobacteriales bacterium]|nr:DUF3108 domain-containing protein [Flavobacteriales bacterium]